MSMAAPNCRQRTVCHIVRPRLPVRVRPCWSPDPSGAGCAGWIGSRSTRPWRSVRRLGPDVGAATWLAFLLYGLFAYLLNGLGAATERLRSDLGVSRGVVGLHATAFAAGLVVGGLAGDRLSRRLGRGGAAIVAAVGTAAGAGLLGARPAPGRPLRRGLGV